MELILTAEDRLKVCKKCPLYSYAYGGMCNNQLWYNPETEEISTTKKDGFKRGCGCLLKSKTAIVSSVCPVNKW